MMGRKTDSKNAAGDVYFPDASREPAMMRVKVERVREGLHPSEVVVVLRTAEGKDVKIVVDKDSVKNDTIDIGYPIAQKNNQALVELPRETTEGLWRVWVAADSLRESAAA